MWQVFLHFIYARNIDDFNVLSVISSIVSYPVKISRNIAGEILKGYIDKFYNITVEVFCYD